MVVNTVAQNADLASRAISGNRASPSWEIELAKSAAKGNIPLRYKDTKII